jgi:hypothetical protein
MAAGGRRCRPVPRDRSSAHGGIGLRLGGPGDCGCVRWRRGGLGCAGVWASSRCAGAVLRRRHQIRLIRVSGNDGPVPMGGYGGRKSRPPNPQPVDNRRTASVPLADPRDDVQAHRRHQRDQHPLHDRLVDPRTGRWRTGQDVAQRDDGEQVGGIPRCERR